MKKTVKSVFAKIINRTSITVVLIVMQALVLISWLTRLSEYAGYVDGISRVLALITALYIINRPDNPGFKLAIIVPILAFPIIGVPFYLLFGNSLRGMLNRQFVGRYNELAAAVEHSSEELSGAFAPQAAFLTRNACTSASTGNNTRYFNVDETFFAAFLEDLRSAKQYIFLEYFIIGEGYMWDSILPILKRKVDEGVEVRVIYDDLGCLGRIPDDYDAYLRRLGIACRRFNVFLPVLSLNFNFRDHRKIAVIDGVTAYTGGFNLGDEYLNITHPHGHWKDAAVRLHGPAAREFSVLFLTFWNAMERGSVSEDFAPYLPQYIPRTEQPGICVPFGDIPGDEFKVGRDVYLNAISRARKSVYITTPYFIVDSETLSAICLAARNGLDVRILVPHIPDKWYVFTVTRSFYPQLIESGVRVYEYTPGFVHSKTVVVDDEVGIISSVNFDYRSMYLQLECGVLMQGTEAVHQLHEDYLQTLVHCEEITPEFYQRIPLPVRIMRSVFRLLSPLM